MCKKFVIAAVVVVGVGYLVAGPGVFGHVEHLFHKAKSSIQDALPLEYELERAEKMLEEIGPEIDHGRKLVAQEQVEVRYLENEIARLERKHNTDTRRLKARKNMLKTRNVSYEIAGRPFSRTALESELRLVFKRFKQNAELLDGKRKLLSARQRSLTAAQGNLAKAATARDTLETRIEHLKARLREEKALAATSTSFQVDDGTLADVREILDRSQKRLDVLRQMRENTEGAAVELTESDALPSTSVIEEIDRFFGDEPVTTSTARATASCPEVR